MLCSDTAHSGAGTGNPALTPTLLWTYVTGGEVFSSPSVVNGVVYVGSFDGNVYALGASPTSSNTPFIIIGVVAAFIIVAAVVFLMFRKRLKTKPGSKESPQVARALYAAYSF
jgi:outer membrane protein assembly factor BamB